MSNIISEDAVRRAFKAIDEDTAWLRRHLGYWVMPLLREGRILDIDTTVKRRRLKQMPEASRQKLLRPLPDLDRFVARGRRRRRL